MPDRQDIQQWTSVIKPVSGWFDIHLSELWRYRDLIMLFVRRDFVSVYKQTILGPLWFLIQPLFTTLVFTVIFGKVAKIPTDGLPPVLFYMSGIVFWNYFAACLDKTSDTFVSNAGIFGKVWFPRLAVPISIVISSLVTFGIQFLLFLCFYSYFFIQGTAISLRPFILVTPFLVIQMAALGLGSGIVVSSMTSKYRDLKYLVGFGVQLWMYATPIVYPTSQIPQKYQWIIVLNPMSPVIEAFRFSFLGVGTVRPWQMGLSIGVTLLILSVGIVLFSRVEKSFMDNV
jgi:lipopolysaccharide transport system permease protein